MQLWFLSVLLNVLAGLVLIFTASSSEEPTETADGFASAPAFFENKTFRLVLGILCVLVGVIKLGVTQTRVPILGDLLPALAGIVSGGALLIEYYTHSSSLSVELPGFLRKICIDEKKYLGIVSIVVAVLHFIFPKILFL
jgi:hypothetical protein